MVSGKDILLYTILIGSIAGAGYLIYEYYKEYVQSVQESQVSSTTATVIPIQPPPTAENPSQPPVTTTESGSLYFATNVSPYSTLSYPASLSSLPFNIDIMLGWTGTVAIQVNINPYFEIDEIIAQILGGLTVHDFKYNPPYYIHFPTQTVTIAPNNKINVPISENLLSYMGSLSNYGALLEILGFLSDGSLIIKGKFGFTITEGPNNLELGLFEENLTLNYSAV